MVKHLTGYLWRFVAFRYFCLACVGRGVAVEFIGRNTPLLYSLRLRFLEEGDLARAAEASRAAEAL